MHIINIKITNGMLDLLLLCSSKSSMYFTLSSISHFKAITFQVPRSHMWLMAAVLDSAGLEAVSLSILQSEAERLPGCCLDLWDPCSFWCRVLIAFFCY